MLRRTFLMLLLAIPFPARAEVFIPFVDYTARSGSLPPEYAWSVTVSISNSGQVFLKHCKGYETGGPACTIRSAQIDERTMQRISLAIKDSGLADTPARAMDQPPVGGGTQSGTIWPGDRAIALPPFPVEEDAPRVTAVLDAIVAAIPQDLRDEFLSPN